MTYQRNGTGFKWVLLSTLACLMTACGSDGRETATNPSTNSTAGSTAGPTEVDSPQSVGKPARPLGPQVRGTLQGMPAGKRNVLVFASFKADPEFSQVEIALMRAQGNSAEVAEDGSFEVTCPTDMAEVTIAAIEVGVLGQSFCSERLRVKVADPNGVAATKPIALRYIPGDKISFQVTDAKTGMPIVKYRVIATSRVKKRLSETTAIEKRVISLAENGRGRNRRHPEGLGTLFGLRLEEGRSPADSGVDLHIDSTGYYRFPLPLADWTPGKDLNLGVIKLNPVSELSFVVLDQETQRPMKSARVTLVEEEARTSFDVSPQGTYPVFSGGAERQSELRSVSAVTDEAGRCALTPIAVERMSLKVSAPLRATVWQRGFMLPDKDKEYTFELTRSARVSVQALDSDGEPRGESWILYEPPAEVAERGPLFSTDEGWVVLPKAYPGTYQVRALPHPLPVHGMEIGQAWDPWQGIDIPVFEVLVEPGARMEAQVSLPPLSSISGQMTRKGEPLEGASVFVCPYPSSVEAEFLHALLEKEGSAYPWLDECDEQGNFYLESVYSGKMFVHVRLPGGGRSFVHPVVVEDDLFDLVIEWPLDSDANNPNREGRPVPVLAEGADAIAHNLVRELLGG